MTLYLDVAVTGVQEWIFRSGDLRGVRGASSALSESTDESKWRDVPGWRWNTDAGNVAGVVSLERPDGAGAVHPEDTAHRVLRRLRTRLPAAHLLARWGDFEGYASFRHPGAVVHAVQSLPVLMENPLARACQACRQAAAVPDPESEAEDVDGPLCADCWVRVRHARFAGASEAWALRRLRATLDDEAARAGFARPRVPSDLTSLAALGARKPGAAPGDAATRLALVSADGNAIGAFVEAAVAAKLDKGKIFTAIHDATQGALIDAAIETCLLVGDGERPDVALIPHVVGGDDIQVSVAAHCAWDFALRFVIGFETRFTSHWTGDDERIVLERLPSQPSMSVGIAFHHAKTPLLSALRDATANLRRAKDSGPGARMAWNDTVRGELVLPDGTSLPPAAPREAVWLTRHGPQLRDLASRPRAHRETLESLVLDRTRSSDQVVATVREVARRQRTDLIVERLDGTPDHDLGLEDVWWYLQIAKDVAPSETSEEPGGAVEEAGT